MNRYRVTRGPVSPPASEHGQVKTLATGATFIGRETPWIRRCLRDGRIASDAPAADDTPASPETDTSARRSRSKRDAP